MVILSLVPGIYWSPEEFTGPHSRHNYDAYVSGHTALLVQRRGDLTSRANIALLVISVIIGVHDQNVCT